MKRATRLVLGFLLVAVGIGLVPAADAGGLPVENPDCGAIIDHSFKLAQPKTCNGTGFNVFGKNDITVDLGGHILVGDGTGGGVVVQQSRVTVRNGTVRGFGVGIDVTGAASGGLVENITAVDNVQYGIVAQGKGMTVRKNVTVANAIGGVSASNDDVAVTNNHVVNNELGINVFSDDVVVRNNHVSSNDGIGIRVESPRAQILGNKVTGNGNRGSSEPGIQMEAASKRGFVSRNLLVGNGDDGYRDDGTRNEASKNVAEGNGYFAQDGNGVGTGIDASAATDSKGSGNRSLGNDASTQCVPAKRCKTLKGAKGLPTLTPACGATVTQSFKLGADKNCTGHGFVVGAPGITIDLAGRTLRGDGGATDYGIVNDDAIVGSGHDDVVITNGVVRAFGQAVRTTDAARTTVTKIVAVDNEQFGVFMSGPDHLLKKSTIVGSDQNGLSVAAATGFIAKANRISNNELGAFLNNIVDFAVIEANVISGNDANGFTNQGDQTVIRGNRILGNGVATNSAGLIGDQGTGSDILSNTIVGNGGTGYIDTSGAPQIEDNIASGNGYQGGASDTAGKGIDASGAPFPTGDGNIVRGNDSTMDECDPDVLCE